MSDGCRHSHPHTPPDAPHTHCHEPAGDSGCAAPPAATAKPVPANAVRTSIRLLQMDCPTEVELIRKRLDAVDTVGSLEFDLLQRRLTVTHAPQALETVLEALRALGFTPEPLAADAPPQPAAATPAPGWPLGLAAAAAAASEIVAWFAGAPVWVAALAILALLICGPGTFRKGWVAIRNGNLNINALMSLAVTGALVLGQWPEAAMVMVLFAIAEWIEARSLDRARHAITGLMQLAPETLTVQQPDGGWHELPAAAVVPGSRVRARPGERIGLDGVIVHGRTSVDQAPITGESLPLDKTEGDAVYAGTINLTGAIEYRVTAAAGQTTLARIIHTIEAAQAAKAPIERFVDRFARVYTPAVVALALAVAVLPPLLAGGAWQDWFYRALVLLVVACPCALVISTPVTLVSALAAGARHGILIKGGVHLEKGRRLAWLALDKTGTLTRGQPQMTGFEPQPGVDVPACRRLARSLAARSDHPVSQAIAGALADDAPPAGDPVTEFTALPGRGVRGQIDGRLCWLGNHRLAHELGRCTPALEARLDALERAGSTVVLLFDERQVLALFAVADTLRDESRDAIAALHGLGIRTLMLSGDNAHTATAIARAAGIDEARGNLLPQDKADAIASLVRPGTAATVGMVGDGINDAPALARADIGFAMGAMGTDTAIETADVALMDDDLRRLATFVRLSRATHAVLCQNIALALGIKALFLILSVAGLGSLWMAVFADVGASLLVVGNGLRLLRTPATGHPAPSTAGHPG